MSALYEDTMVEAAARIWWGNSGHDWDAGIEGEDKPHLLSEFRAVLEAVAPLIAAKALRDMAYRTIAEAVCCDEYEAFKAGVPRPKYAHHICYWGAAHAEALRDRASEIEAGG